MLSSFVPKISTMVSTSHGQLCYRREAGPQMQSLTNYFFNFSYVFHLTVITTLVYLLCDFACKPQGTCGGQRTVCRSQFSPSIMGALGSNSNSQTWQQESLLTEPRHCPLSSALRRMLVTFLTSAIRTPLVICACQSQQWSYFSVKKHIIKLDITGLERWLRR